ncbi:MAG: preprotein translocase subunit SecG [Candidatus Pacebacteria bacterium]|nr:preprotein translocase subunit SecG [Candidatus Paceibacterota bacterium]
MIEGILPYVQIILGVILILSILLQRSDASLGSAFGGDSGGGTQFSRRGFERVLFIGTIVVACLFTISAFLALIV